uniref:L-type lectin-like domain-containing protein n=1 Tax=Parascaris equorum TaxID=6256 RepID=A0A914RWF8_PAREQ
MRRCSLSFTRFAFEAQFMLPLFLHRQCCEYYRQFIAEEGEGISKNSTFVMSSALQFCGRGETLRSPRRALCGVAFFLFSVIISFALPRQNTNGNFVDSEAALINASSIYTLRGAFSKDHSLVKPYDGSTWVIGGMALASTHLVRLTPDIPSRYGSMWNTVPVSFRSWEVEIKFKIYGSDTERSGEGMAFWYVDQSTRSGPAFGFPDVFRGLGVFIDTSEDDVTDINARIEVLFEYNSETNFVKVSLPPHYHPFISALVNNGTIRYAHDAFGTFSQLGGVDGGCYAPLLSEEEPSKMLVRYAARTLSVSY